MKADSATVTPGRSMVAGAVAAGVWGLTEQLDQKLFRCDYSDVAMLGKTFTKESSWWVIGFTIHLANGAIFGLVYCHLSRKISKVDPQRLAIGLALIEHLSLYPLCYFVDRYHPARGEKGIPKLLTNPRAFAQATLRHAIFGKLLGRMAPKRKR